MDDRLKSFRLHLRRALYIPLLMAAVLAATFLVEMYFLWTTNRSVQDSYQSINRTRSALKLALDMEDGVRGYLLTGDYRFMGPYYAAQDRVPGALEQMRHSAASNLVQANRIVRLQEQYEDLHAYMQRMVVLRQNHGDYQSIALNAQGKALMDSFQSTWDQVLGDEEARLAGRVGAVHRAMWLLAASAGLLSLILGFLFSTFTRRELHSVADSYASSLNVAEHRAEETENSRRWLETILGSIADGVIATEANGTVSFMNIVAQKLTGWSMEQAKGARLSDVVHIIDEVTRQPMRELSPLNGIRNAKDYPQLLSLRRRDGIETPVAETSSPLLDQAGKTIGTVLVLRDLTEQRRSEAALRSTDKLASMGRLAASVAHEIHNPLDAIANLLYLLDHSKHLDEVSREHVRLASEELSRITSISEQMLTFSRESRVPVPVKLRDLLDNVLALYQAKLTRGQIQVRRHYENVEDVRAFPGELRQVFSNLIGNAIDAMDLNGRLTVRLQPSRDWANMERRGVRVTIADTGSGISKPDREHISSAFYTTKGEKGTGLGLWVSSGIVRKYEGGIRFRSRTGEPHGSIFQVFLPLASVVGVDNNPAKAETKARSQQQAS